MQSPQKPRFRLILALSAALLILVGVPTAAFSAESSSPSSEEKEQTLMEKAEEHYFAKRYHVALRLFQSIVAREPENGEAFAYLGDIYLILGRYKEAEESIHIAIELSKNPAREYYRLGQLHYLRKQADEAIAAYKKALKLNPRLHIARFQMGIVYLNLKKDKERVIEHWEAFRKLAPDDPQGPAIDKALALLRKKNFHLPGTRPTVSDGENNSVRYKKATGEEEKKNNKKADIIEIDDL